MNRKRVYISGKITGLEESEYRAVFAYAEQQLRNAGYRTVNPTRFVFCRWHWLYRLLGYRVSLLLDLWVMDKYCDMIYLIPGWKESKGACIESFFAYQRGLYRLPLDESKRISKRVMAFMLAMGMYNYKIKSNGKKEESQEA